MVYVLPFRRGASVAASLHCLLTKTVFQSSLFQKNAPYFRRIKTVSDDASCVIAALYPATRRSGRPGSI